jgi:hypothetical protein
MFEVKGITINIRKIFACYPCACNVFYPAIIKNSGRGIPAHAFPFPHQNELCKCDAKEKPLSLPCPAPLCVVPEGRSGRVLTRGSKREIIKNSFK